MQRIVRERRCAPARSALDRSHRGPPRRATASRCPAPSRPRTSCRAARRHGGRRAAACSSSCPAGIGRRRRRATRRARWSASSRWLLGLGARYRPADHVPRDGERQRSGPLAAWFDAVHAAQRRRRAAPPAGREPLLRRAHGSPVAHEPVPVLRRRTRRSPTSRSAERDRASARTAIRDASSPSAAATTARRDARPRRRRDRSTHLFPLGDRARLRAARRASVAAIAPARGLRPVGGRVRPAARARRPRVPALPLLNYGRGSYDGLHDMMTRPAHGAGARRRRRALSDRLRREHDHLPAHPLGARSRRGPRLSLDTRSAASRGCRGALRTRRSRRPRPRPARRPEPHRLRAPAPALPGTGHRPSRRRRPAGPALDGYVATLVAGEIVVDQGELTDARPGTLVRGTRAGAGRIPP